jgi:hypothetical protein
MALVEKIERITKQRQYLHAPTTCCASVFTSPDGEKYLQLDTHGSSSRKEQGKVSQSIQFGEQGARQIKDLIEKIFPNLR